MKTTFELEISLPDELAREAGEAGLLTSEAIEEMLRDRLEAQRSERLRALWQRLPAHTLTEQELHDIVIGTRLVRAEKRA